MARWRWAAGAGAAVLLAVCAIALVRRAPPPAPASARFDPPPHSVAVLAFTNMSGDPGQTYFGDGLAEELINALGRLPGVRNIKTEIPMQQVKRCWELPV